VAPLHDGVWDESDETDELLRLISLYELRRPVQSVQSVPSYPHVTLLGVTNTALTPGLLAAHRKERELLSSDRDWYTRAEAARAANVSETTLMRATRAGRPSSERVGRHRRFPKQALHAWADLWHSLDHSVSPSTSEPERLARRRTVAKLREAGHPLGGIADIVGCSVATVRADVDALGGFRPGRGRQPRRLSSEAREARGDRTAELYAGGYTRREVAELVGSSMTQVGRDLAARGVATRPGRPTPKYPPPEEIVCPVCFEPFTSRFPSWPRRYCSVECSHAARSKARAGALEELGLLGTAAAAAELGVVERRVIDYIYARRLHAERVGFEGALKPAWGVSPAEVARFRREWARGGDGRREASLRPDVAVRRAESDGRLRLFRESGLTDEEARLIVRNKADRGARDVRKRRSGRKPAAAHPRWQTMLDELWDQRWAEYSADLAGGRLHEGDAAPSLVEVRAAVAERDWLEHVEDWPRGQWPASPSDPEAMHPGYAKGAANRIRMGTKSPARPMQTMKAA
jgi:excisionase family DNA binding protein